MAFVVLIIIILPNPVIRKKNENNKIDKNNFIIIPFAATN